MFFYDDFDDEDDEDFDEYGEEADIPDLGPCCICESTVMVRTFVLLERRGPIPGTGWGCVQCGLPSDGAQAVICDACAGALWARLTAQQIEAESELRFVCYGYLARKERIPIDQLSAEPFDHDMSKHPEVNAQ